jgi:uncharacterized membrane protein (DUF106 family)
MCFRFKLIVLIFQWLFSVVTGMKLPITTHFLAIFQVLKTTTVFWDTDCPDYGS